MPPSRNSKEIRNKNIRKIQIKRLNEEKSSSKRNYFAQEDRSPKYNKNA
jgi:hypothetical protein